MDRWIATLATRFASFAARLKSRIVGGTRAVGAAALSAADRTDRKRLRVQAESYAAIVETAVDAIIVADRFGQIRSFNHAAETIFGYSAAEVVGTNLRALMPEPDRSNHDGYLEAYRSTGVRKIIGIGREVEGRRKDGSRVALELSIAEWRDIDGQQCFTGIMRDVTMRKLQERELQAAVAAAQQARAEAEAAIAAAQQARADAEAANVAKTEFLAVMSHEIRTPLTSISGFVDLLSSAGRLTSKQRRYVELVRAANSALLTIVNDILDFSKVEAGLLTLEPQAFSPTALVHDTVEIIRPVALEKRILLKFNVEPGVAPWLMGDAARLRQVLLNLLNNAVKFTEAGWIGVSVRPDTGDRRRQMVRFSVSDTGIGIPREHHHRLFKQFSQTDGSISRRFGGTGLGLAICKRLVELMGGKIDVVSDTGKGTTLSFSAELPPAAAPEQEMVPTPTAEATDGRMGRILLVDDLESNREIVDAYLRDAGYRVEAAASAADAIRMLQQESFDLVLMDIQMPAMDGVTATRQIRALPAPLKDIPVIAMTGNVLPQQVRSFLAAGMNDHVGKPIERAQLYAKVWCWLPRGERASSSIDPAEFNYAKFNELIDNLGVQRVERTIYKFVAYLESCFKSTPEVAKREAHDLINSAGVLGFDSLVELCQQVGQVDDADDARLSEMFADLRQSQIKALGICSDLLLPKLGVPSLRRSA
ncbi:MAG: ATP-binding protein [Xanthobacteraceae bacterium]